MAPKTLFSFLSLMIVSFPLHTMEQPANQQMVEAASLQDFGLSELMLSEYVEINEIDQKMRNLTDHLRKVNNSYETETHINAILSTLDHIDKYSQARIEVKECFQKYLDQIKGVAKARCGIAREMMKDTIEIGDINDPKNRKSADALAHAYANQEKVNRFAMTLRDKWQF